MPDYFNREVQDILTEFEVDADKGLSTEQVTQRQQKYGKNSLPESEGPSVLSLLVSQFTDLMVIILIVAASISLLLGETRDFFVILIIVIINAAIGFYQEYSAEQSVAALKAMQVTRVQVRRNGEVREIDADELVPGDIVLLEEGNRIPADGRIIATSNMLVEEAALTGESNAVSKSDDVIEKDKVAIGDRENMVFMGTSVTFGRGQVVITGTALNTELGNIAEMLTQVEQTQTPLQKRLDQLGKVLAAGALIVVALVFIAGLLRGIPAERMFLTAISLAVAAVPEGLPALVTVGLSLGANRMAARNALIRRLPAVETLGSVTIICSDKTGTLTRNEMTATMVALPGHPDVDITGIGYTPEGEFHNHSDGSEVDPSEDRALGRVIKSFALSTNAYVEDEDGDNIYEVVGDTTEAALLIAAHKAGWTRESLEQNMPRVGELPFSSDRKAMTTLHELTGVEAREMFDNALYVSITKGAPDQLISWADKEFGSEGFIDLKSERRDNWQKTVDEMASSGLRVLGVAYRPLEDVPEKIDPDIERELILLGLIGILDPARPEAKEAVKVAREAGIRAMMITGDHALTAEAISRDLGIIDEGQRAISGQQIDTMSDAQLAATVQETSAFARVSPEHKLRVVKVLQGQNQIVAMTGDGVNDAPALKQADIGVAMGITGTDVSKGAAEMILTDDNFASIVAAVEEGRVVYDNIRKFLRYLLSSNVGEVLVMFVAILAGLKVPLLAIQILWINLVTDGLPAIALGFEKGEPGVMKRDPRDPEEGVFAGGTGRHIVFVGILIAVLTLIGFFYGHTAYGLEPFSETLGLETFDTEQLSAIVGEGAVPEDWASLDTEERLTLIEEQAEAAHESGEEGGGDSLVELAERVPRTIAFSVLALTQIFQIMAIHPGDHASFFRVGFKANRLLMWSVLFTILLQLAVIYLPFMQALLDTVALTVGELALVFLLAFIALLAVEGQKLVFARWG